MPMKRSRKIILAFSIVAKILATLAAVCHGQQLVGTPEEASWRVQVIESRSADGSRTMYAYGSATAIANHLAVTAGHVVDYRVGKQATLYRPDGLKVGAKCIGADRATDLALLELEAAVHHVTLGEDPRPGDQIRAYGFGREGVERSGTGQVKQLYRSGEFVSSLTIESGDSGCGIFNSAGELVGVNSAAEDARRIPGGVEGPSVANPASAIAALCTRTASSCQDGVCNNGIFNGWFSQPAPKPQQPPPANRMQPVQPWPQQQQPQQAAPQIGSDQLQNHEQRIGSLEQWAGQLKRIGDSYGVTQGKIPPLVPIAGTAPAPAVPVQPAEPAKPLDVDDIVDMAAPAIEKLINKAVQPKLDQAEQKINQQIEKVAGKLPLPDELKKQIAEQGQAIVQGIAQQAPAAAAAFAPAIIAKFMPYIAGGGGATVLLAGAGALFSFLANRKAGKANPSIAAILLHLAQQRSAPAPAPQVVPVPVESPPLPQQVVTQTSFVPYETDLFARAHQWAQEQLARRYPAQVDVMESLNSLINQYMAANRSGSNSSKGK